MTISYSYLVLNDKNIKKLKNKFNLDIDDILHLARNGDINLYIRVENIEAGTIIKTEFDECFSLSSFVNSDKKDRCYKDFFNVADYNVDFLTEEDKESCFGFIYESEDESSKEKGKLSKVCFDGFIQIPSRTINESARKIVLDELSAYYFLRDEYGKIETDFILNFSFPNKSLQVPIPNTYILISQLSEVVADELNSIQMNDNSSEEIKKLKSELEDKDKKITELQTALGDKNVPILLGAHRSDDPLKIAIEVRNKYWASYPDNVKSNTQIRDYIIRDYSVTKTFATEIEKIACPIDRKKN
jgi:hypothetical protein